MAEHAAHRLMRLPVTPAHGGAALAVAAATELAGSSVAPDHSIEVALITTIGGVIAIIVGQVVAAIISRHRNGTIDHDAEHAAEQAELAMRTIDHLIDEISDRDAKIARLEARRRHAP